MAEPNRCGPHAELINNGTVRVTRCTCGTVHMTMIPSGVTVRLSAEHFRLLSSGVRMAADRAPPVHGQHTEEVLREIGEA